MRAKVARAATTSTTYRRRGVSDEGRSVMGRDDSIWFAPLARRKFFTRAHHSFTGRPRDLANSNILATAAISTKPAIYRPVDGTRHRGCGVRLTKAVGAWTGKSPLPAV